MRRWIKTANAIREKRLRDEQKAVAHNILAEDQLKILRSRSIDACFDWLEVTGQMTESVIRALTAYCTAKVFGDQRRQEIDIECRALVRGNGLEKSRVALAAWDSLLRAPLQEIVVYHKSGITTD